jgi:hypothetical protein
MRHRAQHQNGHAAVQAMQGVAIAIEEKDVTQPQHQPGTAIGSMAMACNSVLPSLALRNLQLLHAPRNTRMLPSTAVASAMRRLLPNASQPPPST